MPRRFLFLLATTGGGHRGAAQAVAEAMRARYGEQAHVDVVDALAHTPWPFSRFGELYCKLLWGGGYAYALGFCLLDGIWQAQAISCALQPLVISAARALVTAYPADLVVAFHPILVHIVSRALTATNGPPLVAVGTDLAIMHALYVDPAVRQYLVATDDARAQLLRHGVDPARIEVVGLPTHSRFQAVVDEAPRAMRLQLGLDPDRPLVMLIGGGVGFGPLEWVARTVARAGLPAQVAIIAGHNQKLRDRLAGINWPVPVRVEGFRDDIHCWMRAADVLVTKAGPNTIAEALVVGLPLVLWGAIPVQETPNVGIVVDGGAGVWAPGPRRAARAVLQLLQDRDARAQMGRRARALAYPQAAERVAVALWDAATCSRSPAPAPAPRRSG